VLVVLREPDHLEALAHLARQRQQHRLTRKLHPIRDLRIGKRRQLALDAAADQEMRLRRKARDPESRTTQGGTTVTSISVVTDRPARKDGKTYKDENGYTAKDSEFHRVTCFNGLGQNVAKYCTKGQLVTVEGRIHYTSWEDKDGAKRYGCEIIADKVDFLSKGRSGSNEGAPDIDED